MRRNEVENDDKENKKISKKESKEIMEMQRFSSRALTSS